MFKKMFFYLFGATDCPILEVKGKIKVPTSIVIIDSIESENRIW